MRRFGTLITVSALAWMASLASSALAAPSIAAGVVFEDRNGNGLRDEGEAGIAGVAVSNGREVVVTDQQGGWSLPASDDVIFFVVKPRGWMTPVSDDLLPRFFYIHKPAGSPKLEYRGVSPTGPLPASIDFPLVRRPEPDRFEVVMASDPQCRNETELSFLVRDNLDELVGTDAAFGITLGDIVDNTLSLFARHNACFSKVGVPWYNVLGNHDTNQDATRDEDSDETFERVFGPSYYAFNHGPVHFVVLDNIYWRGRPPSKAASYYGGLGEKQLEWLGNDLALVPPERLVVLLMHIPIMHMKDREDLYRLIETRPHCVSFAGHTHAQRHHFLAADDGWGGPEPHHHMVSVVMSGSHFGGTFDEVGLPHATMYDGAPNGYSVVSFDGNTYSIRFKAARRPADHQMNIYVPFEIDAGGEKPGEAVVNVFGGSERSTVEMRIDGGDWVAMRRDEREDPAYKVNYEAAKQRKGCGDRALQKIKPSPHIWVAALPADMATGAHRLEVRTRDMFGQCFKDGRIFVVR